ncbi:DUF1542 domain-containing protein, partial [Limosilactobacillus reuteri]
KAKNTGVDIINNVNVPTPSAPKDAANKAIDDALNMKLDNNKDMTKIATAKIDKK